MKNGRSVLLAGATGLVGSACLRFLLREPAFDRVVVPTRRPLPREVDPDGSGAELVGSEDKLVERVVDFRRLRESPELMQVDEVVCALGTTIKKAGSREAFREVDYEYPVVIGELAREHGARGFRLVSAMGADPRSAFFYNRVKGDVEAAIRQMAFESLTILRPSLLLGERDEFRLGEEIAKRLTFLIPKKYKPVAADVVARALARSAVASRSGVEIVESRELGRHASGGQES